MKLENILKPIESDSIEGHEKELKDKMAQIELEYVDKLFLKKIPPLSKDSKIDSISELISKYTEIPSEIMNVLDRKDNEEELLALKSSILNKISDLYEKDHDHWVEKTEELIKEELEKYKKQEKKEDNTNNGYIENKAGLINFNMRTNMGHLLSGSGISDGDICLEIHFEDFYRQKKEDIKNLFSSSSLEKLAIKIIDEHPETKAVVAESWLMDTPIAKRIGFTVYNKDLPFSNGTFWGQFIDSNGQIKYDEVSKFLETGEPTYKIAAGAMEVEDFLKKYLPPERRGKIKLKEVAQESRDFIEDINRISKELNNNWDNLSFDELVVLINSNNLLAEYFKRPEGKAYIDIFKKAKDINVKKEDMRYFNSENINEIKNKFNKYIEENRNKFIDKEVVI